MAFIYIYIYLVYTSIHIYSFPFNPPSFDHSVTLLIYIHTYNTYTLMYIYLCAFCLPHPSACCTQRCILRHVNADLVFVSHCVPRTRSQFFAFLHFRMSLLVLGYVSKFLYGARQRLAIKERAQDRLGSSKSKYSTFAVSNNTFTK